MGLPLKNISNSTSIEAGGHLSSFLFILAMEGLHVALERAQMTNVFRGISIGALEFG